MTNTRKAYTLVEILIGFSVMAGIMITYLFFTQSSAKEMQHSSEHLNSVIFSQKVCEDLIEELALNPYGLETLGIEDSASHYQELIDGQSVFFSFFEDRRAPFGKIDTNTDGAIDETVQPLYDTARKYKLKVTGRRLADSGDVENRNLVEAQISVGWKSELGKGEFATSVHLFSPVTAKKGSLAAKIDLTSLDSRIPGEVFAKPGLTGAEISAQIGENVSAVNALGYITLVCRDFIGSELFARKKNRIKNLMARLNNARESDLEKQYKLRLDLAEAWYDIGKNCFQITAFLDPHFRTLEQNGSFANARGTGFNSIAIQQDLLNFPIIFEYFSDSMVQARYYYNSLLDRDLMRYKGGKVQMQLLNRLLHLYRIVAILPTRGGGAAEFKSFLERIKEASDGKNPYLYRLAVFERELFESRTEWLARNSNIERLDQILGQRIPEILSFVNYKSAEMVATD